MKEPSGRYYIILEYCNGGSLDNILYDYYKRNGKPFPENYVRYLMKEILLGVKSLHDHGIIHRDLKLGNILVNFKSEVNRKNLYLSSAEVRITDFNTSYIPNVSQPKTFLGTVPNMAPSVVKNRINNEEKPYDEKVDIWSLGTLCYEMLFAKPLFRDQSEEMMFQQILSSKITIGNSISPEARSFLYCMLRREGKKRLSVSELLKHEFINGNDDKFNENLLINSNYQMNNYYNPVYKTNLVMNILFGSSYPEDLANIVTTENTKIQDLTKLYFYKINRPDLVDNYNDTIIFYYNGKRLEISKNSQKTLKDLGLLNGSKIQVVHLQSLNI